MLLIFFLVQECTAYEEKQLLEKVAEMLASSNARKKKLVAVPFKHARFSHTAFTHEINVFCTY